MRRSRDAVSWWRSQFGTLIFHPNGTGQALIRRGKTDADGQGRVA